MSSDKTQTTTSSSDPWPAAQPLLGTTLKGAGALYNNNVGGEVFRGSTVVPYAKQTTQAQGLDEATANAATPAVNDYWNRASSLANDGGLNSLQQLSLDQLKPMAAGEMLSGNPYTEDIINQNARDMGNAINLSASGAGRYGSGVHQDQLSRNIGDMASTARFNNYNTERGYMQDAIGSQFNAGQQQRDNVAGGASILQNALGLRQAPSQMLRGVGAELEDLYGRNINDRLRIFQEEQNKPWEMLARANAIGAGAGQLGGTGTSQAQMPGSSFTDILGGGLGLLSLL
jgi:hypothetical protein